MVSDRPEEIAPSVDPWQTVEPRPDPIELRPELP